MLLKPVYEEPVDTAEDIIERGLTIIKGPNTASIVETSKKSLFESVRQMAELSYVPTVIISIKYILQLKIYNSCV